MVGAVALHTSPTKCSLKNFGNQFHFVRMGREQRRQPSQCCFRFLVLRTKTLVQEVGHPKFLTRTLETEEERLNLWIIVS